MKCTCANTPLFSAAGITENVLYLLALLTTAKNCNSSKTAKLNQPTVIPLQKHSAVSHENQKLKQKEL